MWYFSWILGVGLACVFAILNAIFFPIIYFCYPETAGRSLEEIDLIFAKGHAEKMSYVKAAKELPRLSEDEIQLKAREYGVHLEHEEGAVAPGSDEEKGRGQ